MYAKDAFEIARRKSNPEYAKLLEETINDSLYVIKTESNNGRFGTEYKRAEVPKELSNKLGNDVMVKLLFLGYRASYYIKSDINSDNVLVSIRWDNI